MIRRRPWLVAVALLAVFSLIVVACGDDEGETTTTAAETTTTAEQTTTTQAPTTTEATTTTEAPPELLYDVGVVPGPCPDAVNPDNGCIYLGTLSDFTGAFKTQAPLLSWGHEDFWTRVNNDGGIGPEGGPKFDVIIKAENVQDTGYLPDQHVTAYEQIRGNVAALAETLGTSQTLAALPLFIEDNTVAAVSTWYSGWSFPEIDHGLILETGTNYCFEGMNAFDFAVNAMLQAGVPTNDVGVPQFTYAIVGFPGDYGGDYAFGVKYAAQQYGLGDPVVDLGTAQIPEFMGGTVDEAVAALVPAQPNVIFVVTGPSELAKLMGGVFTAGHQNAMYIGAGPTWNTVLLTAAAQLVPLLEAAYYQTAYWLPWSSDTPGHNAMRAAAEAAGRPPEAASAAYSAGWTMQYAIKAALEQAIANGDLTRAGIAAAVGQLTDVDYEGMLPNRGFAGTADEDAWRFITVNDIDTSMPDGLVSVTGEFTGPTAAGYEFLAPCTVMGG